MRCAANIGTRIAFTLIEILVVIAIIAVLVALVSAAVIPLLWKGPQMIATNEIRQMEVAMAAFQNDMKLRNPPPSLLYLSNTRADYFDGTLPYLEMRKNSFQFITQMFPRLDWNTINWGTIIPPAPARGAILEGDQVLVFILGGPDGVSGFGTDPKNPMAPTQQRKGPWFEFKVDRLQAITPVASAAAISRSLTAPSYLDAYSGGGSANKSPYIYFSSGRRSNGYTPYGLAYYVSTDSNYYGSDCKSLQSPPAPPPPSPPQEPGVFPYAQSAAAPVRYFNPSTFQIICAGRNGVFGPGGLYNPASQTIPQTGMDDLSNFHSGLLGAVQ